MMAKDVIEQSVEVEASPDEVYRALTDAEVLTTWWVSAAKSDPKPGGNFRLDFKFVDASRDGFQEGAYIECVPGKRLSYPWDASLEAPTTVEFTIEQSGSGSRLDLAHSGFASGTDEHFSMHSDAWGFFLQNLKSVLEGGADQRVEALGMRL